MVTFYSVVSSIRVPLMCSHIVHTFLFSFSLFKLTNLNPSIVKTDTILILFLFLKQQMKGGEELKKESEKN